MKHHAKLKIAKKACHRLCRCKRQRFVSIHLNTKKAAVDNKYI